MAFQAILAALIQRGRDRQGRPYRGVDAGSHGRMDGLSHVLRPRWRIPAAARRAPATRPSFPTAPIGRRTEPMLFGLQNDREWSRFRADRAGTAGTCRGRALQGQRRPRRPSRRGTGGNRGMSSRSFPTADIVARLEEAGIGNARVNDMAALWAHPQLAARGRWAEVVTSAGPLPALKPLAGRELGRAARSSPRVGRTQRQDLCRVGPRQPRCWWLNHRSIAIHEIPE